MTAPLIRQLFDRDIHRPIEEVIKVDQTRDDVLRAELDEYIVTKSIRDHFVRVLEAYRETPNKPHEGIAVWVSGFFGSGKSSFAKMLGLAIENRVIEGKTAAERFAATARDKTIEVLLANINEKIPTHAVIFDVSTDRGIRSGNQTLTEIMYGLFLDSLGYAKDLDLSELEIALEGAGKLQSFEQEYKRLYDKDWSTEKRKIAFALSEASRVMHSLDPSTYPVADSWVKAVKNKADISPGKLADRANELMTRRRRGQTLMFVVDEVGQFVARDVQKMLDLQAIVQSFGVRGRGRHWLVVTSQEKLGELVSGLDGSRPEFARLMDRFPQQVHLEPSDISQVTSRRVLSKNSEAETLLGKLYDDHSGRLHEHTRISADIKLAELTRAAFVDLYPLLPYQIDLIIHVVSGLRTQGGGSRHVGGANRTIIKLAQQLLVHSDVNLAERPVGALVRFDQVYDLVETNIASEVRAKITGIPKRITQPLAQSVAKAVCLFQYVSSVRATPENVAAALHPAVAADSQLASVTEALNALEAARLVRRGDHGYTIPTPAEDDWETDRARIRPRPGDSHRLYAEILSDFFKPQPSHALLDTRVFRAGLAIHGREVVEGDIAFHVHLAEEGKAYEALVAELRVRSQGERKHVFWAVALGDAIDHQAVEVYCSREMIARRERDARLGDDKAHLVGEEKRRLSRHLDELRRLLRGACLAGSAFFQGHDRSPGGRATDVGKAAGEILAEALPAVFERFEDAAAKSSDLKRGLDALLEADNLQGLPPVFTALKLLHTQKGKPVFRTDSGPLAEVYARIEQRASYGDTANGRWLADELAKEPFGWDFEAVRLFTLALLRAGAIEATSKGQTIDVATTVEARDAFKDNSPFRQASFRPKKGIEPEQVYDAAKAFGETFGTEVRELTASAVAAELRKEIARREDDVATALGLIVNRLPGAALLETGLSQMKAIVRGSDEAAIATFNTSHRTIKDAVQRAAELTVCLTEPALRDLERARNVLRDAWPFLVHEPDLADDLRAVAAALEDLLRRETFFRDLPVIEQHTRSLEIEYARRYEDALQARIDAYARALQALAKMPELLELDQDAQARIMAPFRRGASREGGPVPIPQLRSERDACSGRLRAAIEDIYRILEGERLATVSLASYFAGGVETEEQLDAALEGIREECARLIGAGKKIVIS